ncbi:MAG: YopX family protein [Acidobacteriota bacterium]
MNRIIKFRAWDKREKKMIVPEDLFDPYNIPVEPDEYGFTLKSKFELMQFTGLLDKNGSEIFEGDIVSWGSSRNMFIKYEDRGMYEFWHTETEKAHHWGIWNIHKELEVIGNIYENPELIINPPKAYEPCI